jgi:hypothetical protein
MPKKNGPKKKRDLTTDIVLDDGGNARLGQATSNCHAELVHGQLSVAPAQAGAHHVYLARLRGEIGPSLRWGDGFGVC